MTKTLACQAYLLLLVTAAMLVSARSSLALEVGDRYKDFALRDSRGTLITLGEVTAGAAVTALDFISIYCDACKKQIPHLNQIARANKARGVRIIGIALANDQADIGRLTEQQGLDYALLADPDKITSYLYNVSRVPQIFLIDASGIIRYRGDGKDWQAFQKLIDSQLDKVASGLKAGDPAPEFALATMHGDDVPVRFARRHQNTILGFFESDDESNRAQARALALADELYQNFGLRVYGVVSHRFAGNLKLFIKECTMQFPVLIDKDDQVFRLYAVDEAPQMVVVNETGRVQRRDIRKTYDELRALFAQATPADRPSYTAEASIDIIRQTVPDVRQVRPLNLGGQTIFIGIRGADEKFIARLVKKDILCDVCTDVHYVLVLNQKGVYSDIRLIKPFELYGKPMDASGFVRQFVGRSYHDHFVPGTNVDTISGATKSCLMFVEGLQETTTLLAHYIADPQFDTSFKAQVCYMEQRELELALDLYGREHGAVTPDTDIQKAASYCSGGQMPTCPAQGRYKVIMLNGIPRVMCTVHGLDPEASAYSLR